MPRTNIYTFDLQQWDDGEISLVHWGLNSSEDTTIVFTDYDEAEINGHSINVAAFLREWLVKQEQRADESEG